MGPEKISAQKIALIAWNKSVEEKELTVLRKSLADLNYRVDVVYELSQLDQQLCEYEKNGESPLEIVSHFHFPKVPLSGLNRRILRRLKAANPEAQPRITAVTQRLLGADLSQFAIDSSADVMVKAADLPQAIIDIFRKPKETEKCEGRKLPVVHADLRNQSLETS
ncbi:MAG: hypothetical protein ACPG7R_04465, partial [Planctomycetota bacterium]